MVISSNPAAIPVDPGVAESVYEQILDYLINIKDRLQEEISNENSNYRKKLARLTSRGTSDRTKRYLRSNIQTNDALLERIKDGNITPEELTIQKYMLNNVANCKLTLKTRKKLVQCEVRFGLTKKKKHIPFDEMKSVDLFGGGEALRLTRDISELQKFESVNATISIQIDYLLTLNQIQVAAKHYKKYRQMFKSTTDDWLFEIISHELAHIADPSIAYKDLGGSAYSIVGKESEYYNIPTEVKARINEYTATLDSRQFDSFDSFIDHIMNSRRTVFRYMNEKNKKQLLSALYAEWQKRHWVPKGDTEFQRRKNTPQPLSELIIYALFG